MKSFPHDATRSARYPSGPLVWRRAQCGAQPQASVVCDYLLDRVTNYR